MVEVLLGALLAGLFGLLGALYQNSREHDRWLRAQRLEAYNAFGAAISRVNVEENWADLTGAERIRSTVDRVEVVFATLHALRLVARDSVGEAARLAAQRQYEGDNEVARDALDQWREEARKDLLRPSRWAPSGRRSGRTISRGQ